jgi:spore coat polysaccharide biosynthesis protein SpsF
METADIAITSFGVTAYELAAKGVPAIYLCLTEDHQESASALAANGMGISLGLSCEIEAVKLLNALKLLLESPDLRLRMSQTARLTMDGKGAERISDLIVDNLEKGSK